MSGSPKEELVSTTPLAPTQLDNDAFPSGRDSTTNVPDIQLASSKRKSFSVEFKLAMVVLIPIVIVAAVYKIAFSPVNLQAINMEIAGEKLPRVKEILDGDKRFKDVIAFVYTGQNGAVGLQGTVDKQEDLFLLMKAVASERIPVAIHWNVRVLAIDVNNKDGP